MTDVIASTVRLLRRRLGLRRGTVSELAASTRRGDDLPRSVQASSQPGTSTWEVSSEHLRPKSSGTRLRAISMEDKVVRAARPQERQFVCVPLSDVSKSVDLACVFAVNAMVFKCECEDPRAVQAGDHLAALLQDMIDVAAELDQACQHALSAEVYGVVRELRRLGFAVAIGHGVLDVHGAPWPASPALKSWDVLCVVLRDADKAVPLALVPTPMNIA